MKLHTLLHYLLHMLLKATQCGAKRKLFQHRVRMEMHLKLSNEESFISTEKKLLLKHLYKLVHLFMRY